MDSTIGIIFIVVLVIALIIYFRTSSSYNNKIKDILNSFRKETEVFYKIAEGCFETKTNGKKVSTWNKDHAIDYIINDNSKELQEALKNFDELKIWWKHSMPKIKDRVNKAISSTSQDLVFKNLFIKKAHQEFERLINLYNPSNIKIRLQTFTFYEEGEEHFNPSTYSYTSAGSAFKTPSFKAEISPDELRERISFLSRHNFTITKFKYECEDQRSIITPEIRHKIIIRDKGICQHCGKKCNTSEIEIDHIIPISKGGKSTLCNLQVLCRHCNRKKGNRINTDTFSVCHQEIYDCEAKSEQTNKKTNWLQIESSSIKSIYYNSKLNQLYVEYINKSIYVYYDVEKQTYFEFLSAASKEQFLRSEMSIYKSKQIDKNEVE